MRGGANPRPHLTSLPQFRLDRILTDRLTDCTAHCLPISLSAGKAEPRLTLPPGPPGINRLVPISQSRKPVKVRVTGTQAGMHHHNGGGRRRETRGRNEGQRGRGKPTYFLSLSHAVVEGEVEAAHSFTFPYSLKRRFKMEGERGQGTREQKHLSFIQSCWK